jgi:hypothetical protein
MADHPMAPPEAGTVVSEAVLTQILSRLESLTISQQVLQAKVCILALPLRPSYCCR